jgi:hypothetical protein
MAEVPVIVANLVNGEEYESDDSAQYQISGKPGGRRQSYHDKELPPATRADNDSLCGNLVGSLKALTGAW